MKNLNISVLLGCVIIGVCIIIAGYTVAGSMPYTPAIPGSLHVTTSDDTPKYNDYMSDYEASAYLMISYDAFISFAGSGQLDGTFTVVNNERVFSKAKLTEWIEARIDSESPQY